MHRPAVAPKAGATVGFLTRILLLGVPVFHLVAWISGADILFVPTAVVAAAAFCMALPVASRQFQVVGCLLVGIGVVALASLKAPWALWIEAATDKLHFFGVVVFAQLLRIPLQAGGFDQEIKKVIRTWSRPWNLSFLISLLTFILTLPGQFGSIPVMTGLLRTPLREVVVEADRFLQRAVARGFGVAMFCAPSSILLAIVVSITGLPWLALMAYGAGMAAIALVLILIFSLRDRPKPWSPVTVSINGTKLAGTLAIIVSLITSIVLLDQFLNWPIPQAIMVSAATVAVVATLLLAGRPGLAAGLRSFFRQDAISFGGQLVLFMGIGFISVVLQHPRLMTPMTAAVSSLVDSWGIPAVLAAVPLIVVGCGFVGIHPIVSITTLAMLLTNTPVADAGLLMGFSLVLGNAAVTLVGPFMNYSVLLGGLLGVNPFVISLRWNMDFTVALLALFCTIIYVLAP